MQDVNYQLFAESVEAECTFGIRRPDTALVDKTLDALGLAPLRERHPNTLSGGQKQRLAAAAAMVCGKELLVFDEPTSGLDYDSMVRLAALIRRRALRRRRRGVSDTAVFRDGTCHRQTAGRGPGPSRLPDRLRGDGRLLAAACAAAFSVHGPVP